MIVYINTVAGNCEFEKRKRSVGLIFKTVESENGKSVVYIFVRFIGRCVRVIFRRKIVKNLIKKLPSKFNHFEGSGRYKFEG